MVAVVVVVVAVAVGVVGVAVLLSQVGGSPVKKFLIAGQMFTDKSVFKGLTSEQS